MRTSFPVNRVKWRFLLALGMSTVFPATSSLAAHWGAVRDNNSSLPVGATGIEQENIASDPAPGPDTSAVLPPKSDEAASSQQVTVTVDDKPADQKPAIEAAPIQTEPPGEAKSAQPAGGGASLPPLPAGIAQGYLPHDQALGLDLNTYVGPKAGEKEPAQQGTVAAQAPTSPQHDGETTEAKLSGAPPKTEPSSEAKSAEHENTIGVFGGSYLRSLNDKGGVISLVVADQEADIKQPIDLAEAVALSLKNNYGVLASGSATSSSFYSKLSAYSEYMPQVQVNLDKGNEYSAPASINDAYGNRVLESFHPRWDRNIVITQPLIDLNIISDILIAHDNANITKEDERDVREGTAYDTATVFLKLIQSQISMQLADQYKAYLDDLSRRMTQRFDGGGATKADLERIRGRSTLAESAKIEALGEYRSNLSEFTRITRVVPAALKIPKVLGPSVPGDVQAALGQAVRSNPAYLGSLKKVDAAADDRNKYAANLMPRVSLQYSKSHSWDAGAAAQGNPVDGVWPNQETDSIMLVASWELNGGTSVATGLAGIQKTNEMRYKAKDIRARLEESVRTGYEAVNTAQRRIPVLQDAVNSDERVVHDFEAQFKQGNRTLFDLLDAYEQLYNARLSLMRLVVAEAQASFQVRRQIGDLAGAILSVEEP